MCLLLCSVFPKCTSYSVQWKSAFLGKHRYKHVGISTDCLDLYLSSGVKQSEVGLSPLLMLSHIQDLKSGVGEVKFCHAVGYGHQCFPQEQGGRCPTHQALQVSSGIWLCCWQPLGRRAELALLLESLGGGYPVLLSDRCAGGASLQPQHTKSKAGLWHE